MQENVWCNINMNDLLLSYRVDGNNNLEGVIQPQGITEHEECQLLVAFEHLCCCVWSFVLIISQDNSYHQLIYYKC